MLNFLLVSNPIEVVMTEGVGVWFGSTSRSKAVQELTYISLQTNRMILYLFTLVGIDLIVPKE